MIHGAFPPSLLSWISRVDEILKLNKTLALGTALVISLTILVRYIRSPFRKLPPGPPGVPILGNALSLRTAQWKAFMEWKKKYGAIHFYERRCVLTK